MHVSTMYRDHVSVLYGIPWLRQLKAANSLPFEHVTILQLNFKALLRNYKLLSQAMFTFIFSISTVVHSNY